MRSMIFIAFILLAASAALSAMLVQQEDAALQPVWASTLLPPAQNVVACTNCHSGTVANTRPTEALHLPAFQAECRHCHSTEALQRRWQGRH